MSFFQCAHKNVSNRISFFKALDVFDVFLFYASCSFISYKHIYLSVRILKLSGHKGNLIQLRTYLGTVISVFILHVHLYCFSAHILICVCIYLHLSYIYIHLKVCINAYIVCTYCISTRSYQWISFECQSTPENFYFLSCVLTKKVWYTEGFTL